MASLSTGRVIVDDEDNEEEEEDEDPPADVVVFECILLTARVRPDTKSCVARSTPRGMYDTVRPPAFGAAPPDPPPVYTCRIPQSL